MRFPVTIRHRTTEAKIYAPAKNFAYYRLAYAMAGKRRMQTFATYPEARQAAERVVKEVANGSQAAALSASQSRDALTALERLESFRQATGKRVSLLSAVSEFVEAASKLNGHTLSEAVERFLSTVANVQRKDVREPSPNRKRPYFETFPQTAEAELPDCRRTSLRVASAGLHWREYVAGTSRHFHWIVG